MQSERAPQVREELYTLRSGDQVRFDPTRSLRPDLVTEALGYEAAAIANVLNFMHVRHGTLDRPISVLDLGCGTGISQVACLSKLRQGVQVEFTAIDKDAYCVEQTGINLGMAIDTHASDTLVSVQLQDWFDPVMWEELGKQRWDVILFNPPYKAPGEFVRPEFAEAPVDMIYAHDPDGLEHFEHVLPLAIPLLSDLEGATALIRLPSYYTKPTYFDVESFRERRIDSIVKSATREAGGDYFILRGTRGLYTSGRGVDEPYHNHIAVSRGSILAPHYDPIILEAMLKNYPGVPRTHEEFTRMRSGQKGST